MISGKQVPRIGREVSILDAIREMGGTLKITLAE
jgi:hypothetical protein